MKNISWLFSYFLTVSFLTPILNFSRIGFVFLLRLEFYLTQIAQYLKTSREKASTLKQKKQSLKKCSILVVSYFD